jgi:hypothetical protein
MNEENILKVSEALKNAKVPTDDRYFVDSEGYIHGPITITRSEFVPTNNKPSKIKVHKIK